MKFTVLLLLLVSFYANAESTKTISFDGQEFDEVLLENEKYETRYRDEEVDDTCTRQIPYVVNECGYETRYRTECRQVPGYQDCRTINDRQCRTVHRTRRECSNVGGGRDCRHEPPREQCRTNSRGERRCRTLPGRRICTDKPPRRVCRDVPYTDRVCTNNPRRVCNWVPSRQVCEDVPYQEHVCRDVTRYRTEEYACRRTIQVPYQVLVKKFEGNIGVKFKESNTTPSKADLTFNLNSEGKIDLKITDRSENPALILGKQKISSEDLGDTLQITSSYSVNFLDKTRILAPVLEAHRGHYLNETHYAVVMGKVLKPEAVKFNIKIVRKSKTILSKDLNSSEYKLTEVTGGTKFDLSLKQYDIDLRRRDHVVTLTTEMIFKNMILNAPKPELKRSQSKKIKAIKD